MECAVSAPQTESHPQRQVIPERLSILKIISSLVSSSGGDPTRSISYFTHVKDLLEDMHEVTGADAVRLLPDE